MGRLSVGVSSFEVPDAARRGSAPEPVHAAPATSQLALGRAGRPVMDIATAVAVSASGMEAQTPGLLAIAENMSGDDTAGPAPGRAAGKRRRGGVAQARRLLVEDGGALRPEPKARGSRRVQGPGDHAKAGGGRVQACVANVSVLDAARALLARTIDLLR